VFNLKWRCTDRLVCDRAGSRIRSSGWLSPS